MFANCVHVKRCSFTFLNVKIFQQTVANLGSFGKQMGFFSENNFKIAKCIKHFVECVSSGIISVIFKWWMLAIYQTPTDRSSFNCILLDRALQFFTTLAQATRDDFNAAITALRNHYCNPNLRELHKLLLHNLKIDHKNGIPEDSLVQVQIKATQAYPNPLFPPITPDDPPNNQATLDNAVNERNWRIKEILTNTIPNLKRKLLDQNDTATVQDLCTVARRQMVFFELCPSDDWTRDALNEVSSALSENIVGALTKLTQQQEELN